MSWIQEVLQEMSEADPYGVVFDKPVAEGEKVVGQLSDEHRRLWAVISARADGFSERVEELKQEHPLAPPPDEELEPLAAAEDELKALKNFFWGAVRMDLGVNGTDTGVREEGRVVALPTRDCGCGKGSECGLVKVGIIDPSGGEVQEQMVLAAIALLGDD